MDRIQTLIVVNRRAAYPAARRTMKRAAISVIALANAALVSFADPRMAVALPPPCPDQQTMSGCIDICPPNNHYEDCLALAGRPANCLVVDMQCDESYWCTQLQPVEAMRPDYLLQCTYQSIY